MRIGVPQERLAQETRAAATPKTVEQLLKLGFSVAVESGAGKLASFDDEAFAEAGAEIVTGDEVWQSDVILKVNAPNDDEIALLNPGTTPISFIWPAQNPQLMKKAAAAGLCNGDGFRAAYFPRPVAGCAQLNGQHRRVPRYR